jgi:hypothetical protein
MKTQIQLLMFLAMVVSISACVSVDNVPGTVRLAQFVPNPAQSDKTIPDLANITGSFRGEPRRTGETNRIGGGCLVYQPADNPLACASNAQCDITSQTEIIVNGYCDFEIPGTPIGQAKGTCWYQPESAESACLRGVDIYDKTFALGPTEIYQLGAGKPVNWRVLTCQNILQDGCKILNGVQGTHRIYRFGPISKYPPP